MDEGKEGWSEHDTMDEGKGIYLIFGEGNIYPSSL